jgi:hypothetical protein
MSTRTPFERKDFSPRLGEARLAVRRDDFIPRGRLLKPRTNEVER